MTEEILIESVTYVDELYPRGGFDNEMVNHYRIAIDNLPPIEITHENILIDGYHRLIAHRMEGRETINAIVEELDQEDVLWEATKRNASHGLQLNMAEKKSLARKFFGLDDKTQAEIASVLSVTQPTVSNWVKDLKEEQDMERDAKIWQMWLACCTYNEIANVVGYADKTGPKAAVERLKNIKTNEIQPPDSLQVFNLWNFQTCDDSYGMNFPGRIPGQIVENVLYYYTEPFDIVVDPMAGGGTTLDVCKKTMDRRYRCYDISPVRDDIKKHDITTGFPKEAKGCDLIFLDPPYWKQKQGDYSGDETNLANLPLEEFYTEMGKIFDEAHGVLTDSGHIAVIIGPTQSGGVIYDHAFVLAQLLGKKFAFVNRIIVPYTTQQAKPYHVTDAKDGHYMLKLYRDLLIFKKE